MTVGVIAIDGPGGSGKSTVSRSVGERLGLDVLDTGAMYRAVTLAALRRGVDPSDGSAATVTAEEAEIVVGEDPARPEVRVDGDDVTVEIRGREVTAAVSAVSAHPGVREALVGRQRAWIEARGGSGVVEGRDIGTVVFPGAAVKVFLTANEEVRAARRQGDEQAAAREVDADTVRRDLARRDRFDSDRPTAPLRPAEDAVIIDTSDLSVEDVVDRIVELVEEAGISP